MKVRFSSLIVATAFTLPLWAIQAQATPFAFDLIAAPMADLVGNSENVRLVQTSPIALNNANDLLFRGSSELAPFPAAPVTKMFLHKSGSGISELLRSDSGPGQPFIGFDFLKLGERAGTIAPTAFFTALGSSSSIQKLYRLDTGAPGSFDSTVGLVNGENSRNVAVGDSGFVARKDQTNANGSSPIKRSKCQNAAGSCNPLPEATISSGAAFNGDTPIAVNTTGQTAFIGRNPSDADGVDDVSIFVSKASGSSGAALALVSNNDAAPEFPLGSTFSGFFAPHINDAGKIAFTALVDVPMADSSSAVYTINADGSGLTRAVAGGDLELAGSAPSGLVKINNGGELAFAALDSATGNASLHMTVGGSPRLVAKEGDAIAGGITATKLGTFRFDFNDQGKLAFYAGPSPVDSGLFIASFDEEENGGGDTPNITQVAELVTGSDAVLSQILDQDELDATSGDLDLTLDYRFLTPVGVLDISVALLNSLDAVISETSLGSLVPAGDLFLTESLTIVESLADTMRNAVNAKLLFTLSDGLSDPPSIVQLDNIVLTGLLNGDFETGDLTNWADESEGNATVSNQRATLASVPEPATAGLLFAGLVGLGWLRRRTDA